MLAAMTSAQFVEWRAYFALEPWDEERADLRAAIIAATIANAHRDRKRRPTPIPIESFMPRFDAAQRRPAQTWQQQQQLARLIASTWTEAAP